MSQYLNNAAVVYYDKVVKDLYQGMGMLKNYVDIRSGVIGESVSFTNRAVAEAQLRGAPGSMLPTVNPNYQKPVALLDNWVWPLFTDVFQQKEVYFDEIASVAQDQANALGRRTDKIVINAAVASGTTNVIATGAANLTFNKLLQVLEYCDAIGIPYNEVTVAISAKGLSSLLKDDHITNYFYTDAKPLASGSLREFLGMRIITLPDNNNLPPDGSSFSGSLPLTGTVRTGYAFHRRAIGYAESAISARVDYVADKFSWLSVAALRAGAIAVDPTGIIAINYDEAV